MTKEDKARRGREEWYRRFCEAMQIADGPGVVATREERRNRSEAYYERRRLENEEEAARQCPDAVYVTVTPKTALLDGTKRR